VTNIEFARFLLADPDVEAGRLDTGLLDRRVADFVAAEVPGDVFMAAGVYRWLQGWCGVETADPWAVPSGWRVSGRARSAFRLSTPTLTGHVFIAGSPTDATVAIDDGESHSLAADLDGTRLSVTIDGLRATYVVVEDDGHIWLAGAAGVFLVRELEEVNVRVGDVHAGQAEITSPMPGAVIAVNVENGAEVTAGTAIVVVEAMKMEHALRAPIDGTVELLVGAADQVKVDQVLARIVPPADENSTSTAQDKDADR